MDSGLPASPDPASNMRNRSAKLLSYTTQEGSQKRYLAKGRQKVSFSLSLTLGRSKLGKELGESVQVE